jgi:hypothetical protein
LVIGTGLGNLDVVKTATKASKITCEIMATKIESTSNSRPHVYFTEYLMCVIEKSQKKRDKNYENSSH